MPKDLPTIIVVCLIIVLVIVAIIVLIILISDREKKYRAFVKENSDAIHKLERLNKQYVFKEIKNKYSYYHRFDNKGWYTKTEPIDYLTRLIRNNLEGWFRVRDAIVYNRETLTEYKNDVGYINDKISEQVCLNNKKKYKKCLKVEKKVFNSLIQKPTTNISIDVKLRYVSPKGKVDISKNATFAFTGLNRIVDSVSPKRVDKETYERLATAERAMISDSMRYDVLKRDGFRCVLCGMSASDGAILHVDHIIPVSKGGKSEISNLRTLCERCNLGKSNKIE